MTESREAKLRHAIRQYFLGQAHTSLGDALAVVSTAKEAFLAETARQVQRPLNAYLATQAQETFRDKSALARSLSTQLEKLGLRIRHPETGEPALLIGVRTGDDQGAYAYRLESEARDYDALIVTTLPELELIPAPAAVSGRRLASLRI